MGGGKKAQKRKDPLLYLAYEEKKSLRRRTTATEHRERKKGSERTQHICLRKAQKRKPHLSGCNLSLVRGTGKKRGTLLIFQTPKTSGRKLKMPTHREKSRQKEGKITLFHLRNTKGGGGGGRDPNGGHRKGEGSANQYGKKRGLIRKGEQKPQTSSSQNKNEGGGKGKNKVAGMAEEKRGGGGKSVPERQRRKKKGNPL